MPVGTLILSGVLALLAGTLFRLAGELDIPALRMLGFWSLVAIGLLLSRAAARQQIGDGWRRLRQALAGLGPEFRVVPGAGDGQGGKNGAAGLVGRPLFIVAPGGVLALTPDAMADYGRGTLARRRLAVGVARARAWAEAGAAVLAEAGKDAPLVPCLVLLRRRAPQERAEPGAGEPVLVNPEGIPALAGRFRQPGRLDPAARQAVAGVLEAWVAAHGRERIR